MSADGYPDLLILGDSHSAALKSGCDAHGLRAEVLSFSGNVWHEGYVSFHPAHGIRVRGRAQADRLADVLSRLGAARLPVPEVPILASVGFHLGRLVPRFGFNNHMTTSAEMSADAANLFASSGFVRAYAQAHRAGHVRFLRRLSRQVPLVAVAPPPVYTTPNYPAFITALSGLIREAGVTLYDPREDIGKPGKPLDKSYLAEDAVHGNDRYGKDVIGHMVRRGLIGARAA